MPQIINTNVMSLNSQRQLNKSQAMQNQAMERLSSGLRINSAKDDAAGLAISTGMESQIRGLNQAVRNANDGISMAQTAEGAMDEMTNILQRMRELSIQAANDTNSASNRASIQDEIDQLYSELDRIASVTQFNGVNLLDGSAGSTNFQIGANTGESISFKIDAVTTADLSLNAVTGTGELNGGRIETTTGGTTNDAVTINGVTISGLAASSANGADDIVLAINASTGLSGVTATGYNVVEGVAGGSGVISAGGLTIAVDGGNAISIGASGSMAELADNINRDAAGVIASISTSGALVLTNDTGKTITVSGADIGNTGLIDDTYQGFVSLNSSDGDAINLAASTAGTFADLKVMGFNTQIGSDNVTGGTVNSASISETDKILINGVELGAVSGTSAADKAFAVNAISAETGVNATATTTKEYTITFGPQSNSSGAALATGAVGVDGLTGIGQSGGTNDTLKINGVAITALATTSSMDAVVSAINNSGVQGVVASATADGKLELTSVSGNDIALTITQGSSGALLSGAGAPSVVGIRDTITNGAIGSARANDVNRGSLTLIGENGKDVVVTTAAGAQSASTAALDKLGLSDAGGSSTAIGIGLSVTTVRSAENTIERIDDALEKISSIRGKLGAIQNRLSSTISNLANVSQNLSSAKSQIVDADFAAETSKMSKAQILQQAGTAMLAQANASTQNVLSLLQG
ncbi:MAG: flagellin [Colwellia sp.]|nr:flagellin [Colwellia sp.]NQZ80663.1 flagellin [Colwellia sp.]